MEINLYNTDTIRADEPLSYKATSTVYATRSVPTILTNTEYCPEYKTSGSAGADLTVNVSVVLNPNSSQVVTTGVRLAIPDGFVGLVFPRSGLASKGVTLANSVGVVDSDYRGEIQLALVNRGADPVQLNAGDRVAQIVFLPVTQFPFVIQTTLDSTTRGTGGFGSTGV